MKKTKDGALVGGRGSFSQSWGGDPGFTEEEIIGGQEIAQRIGVTPEKGVAMYRAVQNWANGSSGIKNAQRGTGPFTEQDARDAALLEEFIGKSPGYNGELVRVMNVPEGTGFRKGDRIEGDGSATSWTVPENRDNALHGFGRETGVNVMLHVNATSGLDTRGLSGLDFLDAEIIEAAGYDSGLTVTRTKREKVKTWAYPEGIEVLHVYVEERR